MNVIIENYNSLVKKYHKLEKEMTEKEIHDKRVILRKVFPILATYKINPARIRNGEKTFKLFGKLRDVQIQIMMLESMDQIPEITDYYVFLKELEISKKEVVRKFCKKKKLEFPVIKNKSSIDKAKIVRKAEKSLSKIRGMIQVWSIDDAEYIHQIRIEYKKFRYQVEILSNITCIPEEKLERIRLYQDKLGEIHDYEVLIDGITKFYHKKKQDEEVSTDLFEEKQNLLIDEFEQNHEAFLAICKDVLSLSDNVVGLNNETTCEMNKEPKPEMEQELRLNESDAESKDEVADKTDLIVSTDNEIIITNEPENASENEAIPIVGKVSSKKINKRPTKAVSSVDKEPDSPSGNKPA